MKKRHIHGRHQEPGAIQQPAMVLCERRGDFSGVVSDKTPIPSHAIKHNFWRANF
jgi:hypothetical protein